MEGLHNFINDINGFIWTYIIIWVLIGLGKYAFIALDDYITQKKNGVEEPVFNALIIPDTRGIHAWGKE